MTTSGAVEQSFDGRVTTCKHNTTHIPADVSHYSTNRHLVAVTCKNTLIYTSKKKRRLTAATWRSRQHTAVIRTQEVM